MAMPAIQLRSSVSTLMVRRRDDGGTTAQPIAARHDDGHPDGQTGSLRTRLYDIGRWGEREEERPRRSGTADELSSNAGGGTMHSPVRHRRPGTPKDTMHLGRAPFHPSGRPSLTKSFDQAPRRAPPQGHAGARRCPALACFAFAPAAREASSQPVEPRPGRWLAAFNVFHVVVGSPSCRAPVVSRPRRVVPRRSTCSCTCRTNLQADRLMARTFKGVHSGDRARAKNVHPWPGVSFNGAMCTTLTLAMS
ncbi:hypothetical protein RJ55_08479 [Drechmeria coniospora]|nr:hypothetical protein RJ55_08479 [Drechmeria coniospora]